MYKEIVKTIPQWRKKAEKELLEVLEIASEISSIRKLGPKRPWDVSVTLLAKKPMQELNQMYRGKDKPTDVLSFPSPEVFRKQGHLGELIICLPVLKSQARELKHAPELELKVLLAHGLLHLLGMDHERGAAHAARQRKAEEEILKKWVKGRTKAGVSAAVRGLIERSR